MEPPRHILDMVQSIDPHARIGWDGERKKFSLIELRRTREDSIIGQPWEHGPIYGKPYDVLSTRPVAIYDFTCEEVFNGTIVDRLKEWITPFKTRMEMQLKERGKDYEKHVSDLSGEAQDYLKFEANKTGSAGAEAVPYKHLTQEEKDVLAGTHESQKPLDDVFLDNAKYSAGGALT